MCAFQYGELSEETKDRARMSHIRLLKKHGLWERVLAPAKGLIRGLHSPKEKEEAKEKKKEKAKAKEKDKTAGFNELCQKMEDAFLSQMDKADYSWSIERDALKKLVKKAEARENPEEFAHALIGTFWKMISGNDKFWGSQPFLPHTLNGVSIYPQVVKEMAKREAGQLSAEDLEFIKGMKF